MTALPELEAREGGRLPVSPRRHPRRHTGRRPSGRTWAVLWAALVVWCLASWLDGEPTLNTAGAPMLGEFWRAALSPDLSSAFIRRTVDASLTTVAFAVLGTVLSVVAGLLVAPLVSQTWWRSVARGTGSRAAAGLGLVSARLALVLPRGVHEAVWGLLLVTVLGRDPLVGVLAIAVPFGAITAKVYADLLDETPQGPYEALRAQGAGRVTAFAYGLLPSAWPALTSYAFYRFECSIRSAVILGMVGAGGLGLQLSLSFQGLAYDEMWTSIYALVLLGAAVDRWGALLRRGAGRRRWTASGVVLGLLTVGSLWHLSPDLERWTSGRALPLLAELLDELSPPRLPDGGWEVLLSRSVETAQISVVAITLAATTAVIVALLAARGAGPWWLRVLGPPARAVLLVTRAIPPPVWALLVLFVMVPGPLPGAVALGVYTFGILGRLFAEVVEELDPHPREALTLLGAGPVASFGYASLPAATGAFVAYALYRWEVTARETVVVGVVGAGGLGRLLEQQRAAFDLAGMAATVLALVVVSVVVDLLSMAVRRSLR